MSLENQKWIRGVALSAEKYSYLIIKKECEKRGFNISTYKISGIIHMKRKHVKVHVFDWEKGKKCTPNKGVYTRY